MYLKTVYFLLFSMASIASWGQKNANSNSNRTPKYIAFVGTENKINQGFIEKSHLKAQVGISCMYACSDNDYLAPCGVSSYDLLIISDNQVVYSTTEKSPFFRKDTKKKFDTLKVGDFIIIYNIEVHYPKGTEKAPSIVYRIK